MKENDPVHSGNFVRVPGLYRRWELPEILKNHRFYRIEKAGAHQDGTPLVAVYAGHRGDQGNIASTDNIGPVSSPAETISPRCE